MGCIINVVCGAFLFLGCVDLMFSQLSPLQVSGAVTRLTVYRAATHLEDLGVSSRRRKEPFGILEALRGAQPGVNWFVAGSLDWFLWYSRGDLGPLFGDLGALLDLLCVVWGSCA